MIITQTKKESLQHIKQFRNKADKKTSIGFIPTMGCLHNGHISLVERAKENCDFVIASIFVNPRQFGEGEDFEKYPRKTNKDLDLLEKHKTDLVFLPKLEEIYPKDKKDKRDDFDIKLGDLENKLCGIHRSGHFTGVAEAMLRLLRLIKPDKLFMGEKDYQQILVVEKIIRDFDLGAEMVRCPIIRESNGLAMSSRNRYLDSEQIQIASEIYRYLEMAANEVRNVNNVNHDEEFNEKKYQDLLLQSGFDSVEYFRLCDGYLNEIKELDIKKDRKNYRIFVAARIDKTRLIDNIAI